MTDLGTRLAVIACLGALALIGLLPRLFFRRGRLNAAWWLTALPFVAIGAVLIAALLGRVATFAWLTLPAVIGAGCALAGAGMIVRTIREHRVPLSLWHQEDDRPAALVTSGPYAFVRHPFYTSFLLVAAGSMLVVPHPLTGLAFAAAFVQLDRTARREETRLRAAFGAEYDAYMRRTGRFLPALRTRGATTPTG